MPSHNDRHNRPPPWWVAKYILAFAVLVTVWVYPEQAASLALTLGAIFGPGR